jgi:hypothetical protein
MNEAAASHPEVQRTSWPFSDMAMALLVSLIFAGLLLPSLDLYDGHRLLLYSALVAIFIIRWRIAVVRHEQGRGWRFYFGFIFVAPLIAERFVHWATPHS